MCDVKIVHLMILQWCKTVTTQIMFSVRVSNIVDGEGRSQQFHIPMADVVSTIDDGRLRRVEYNAAELLFWCYFILIRNEHSDRVNDQRMTEMRKTLAVWCPLSYLLDDSVYCRISKFHLFRCYHFWKTFNLVRREIIKRCGTISPWPLTLEKVS